MEEVYRKALEAILRLDPSATHYRRAYQIALFALIQD